MASHKCRCVQCGRTFDHKSADRPVCGVDCHEIRTPDKFPSDCPHAQATVESMADPIWCRTNSELERGITSHRKGCTCKGAVTV